MDYMRTQKTPGGMSSRSGNNAYSKVKKGWMHQDH